ncbi:MAG TPA: hypothetical protein VI854_07055, partial [Acidimicrobiia bacterium]|nr:hypothetical protein [Acidimicrobiia bacterium]
AHLQRVTGIPAIIELAGSTENLLAVECGRADGLHVVPDTSHIEILDPSSGGPAAPGERGAVVHTTMVPWGSVYIRYDGGDLGTIDPTACPCGLPSARIKIVGRAENTFVLGRRTWLPYDVQAAIEEAVPELAGVPFAILREGLAANRLSLLFQAPEEAVAAAVDKEVPTALRGRFDVEVDARWSKTLPLLLKGVTPLLSEREVGE